MKPPPILIAFLILPFWVNGQRTFLMNAVVDSFSIDLIIKENRLFLQGIALSKSTFLPIAEINLEDADLVVSYRAGNMKKSDSYYFDLTLMDPSGNLRKATPAEMIGAEMQKNPGDKDLHKVTWMDVTETSLWPNGKYKLYVYKYLLGEIDCEDVRPVFSYKQQWPHYAAAGVGLALIGASQIYRSKKEDAYNTYRDYWKQSRTATEANPFLEKANDYESKTKNFLLAGVAVIGADAIVYAIRQFNIRERQKLFDKYCTGNGLTWDAKPFIDFSGVGTTLTLQF